jgi:uracil-DNA glycosylase
VEAASAGSHAKLGGHNLTGAIVAAISDNHDHIVFILWGNHAQQRRHLINESRHLVIATAHPSPLSANRGFFGSRPFSKTNAYLENNGLPPIHW